MPASARNRPPHLTWTRPGEPLRAELEAGVARTYRDHYGAEIQHFHDGLLGVYAHDELLQGVIGWTPAIQGPLFLEQYLPAPVDRLLTRRVGVTCQRPHLVEVGNLASTTPGAARTLMSCLAQHLNAAGYTHALLTATAGVRKLLARMGADCVDLGSACGTADGIDLAAWGTYYDHDPRVVALDLPALCRRIDAREGAPVHLPGLWRSAKQAGFRKRLEWAG